MATSFPTGLDALTNPTSADTLASPDHAAQHANVNDAVEAIEVQIGTTASPVLARLASPTFTGTPTLPTGTIATTQSAGNNTTAVATTAFVTEAIPVGVINPYAGSSAPSGWLLCYGQSTGILRSTYSALFAVIGTTYGAGDGTTTFNLPDLRGRAIAGIDNMGGTDAGRLSTANTAGTTTGTETITLTSAESGVPAHSHVNTLTNNAVTSGAMSANSTHSHHATYSTTLGVAGNSVTGAGKIYAGGTIAYENYQQLGSTQDISHTHSVTSNVTITNVNNATANAASAHNNMQPTMVLNYIIKAQ